MTPVVTSGIEDVHLVLVCDCFTSKERDCKIGFFFFSKQIHLLNNFQSEVDLSLRRRSTLSEDLQEGSIHRVLCLGAGGEDPGRNVGWSCDMYWCGFLWSRNWSCCCQSSLGPTASEYELLAVSRLLFSALFRESQLNKIKHRVVSRTTSEYLSKSTNLGQAFVLFGV